MSAQAAAVIKTSLRGGVDVKAAYKSYVAAGGPGDIVLDFQGEGTLAVGEAATSALLATALDGLFLEADSKRTDEPSDSDNSDSEGAEPIDITAAAAPRAGFPFEVVRAYAARPRRVATISRLAAEAAADAKSTQAALNELDLEWTQGELVKASELVRKNDVAEKVYASEKGARRGVDRATELVAAPPVNPSRGVPVQTVLALPAPSSRALKFPKGDPRATLPKPPGESPMAFDSSLAMRPLAMGVPGGAVVGAGAGDVAPKARKVRSSNRPPIPATKPPGQVPVWPAIQPGKKRRPKAQGGWVWVPAFTASNNADSTAARWEQWGKFWLSDEEKGAEVDYGDEFKPAVRVIGKKKKFDPLAGGSSEDSADGSDSDY